MGYLALQRQAKQSKATPLNHCCKKITRLCQSQTQWQITLGKACLGSPTNDQHTPRLSPAYDIVTTSVYIANETKLALNLNKVKSWHTITMAHFQRWAEKSGLPWRAIQPHLKDTIARARDLWPAALAELPMHEPHQAALKRHWQQLQPDFRLL
jgi:hypothetical protein